jgi:hypothetical protein
MVLIDNYHSIMKILALNLNPVIQSDQGARKYSVLPLSSYPQVEDNCQ